jgi:hypothetical protein
LRSAVRAFVGYAGRGHVLADLIGERPLLAGAPTGCWLHDTLGRAS